MSFRGGTPGLNLLVAAFSLMLLAPARSAVAHSDYERLERVIHGGAYGQLQLVKSYTDGIFFADPVKLVVRSGGNVIVAETDFGRDVSVVCFGAPRCVVFRYVGVVPILPEDAWVLEEGKLHPSAAWGHQLLGIVAPLWDHAVGYLMGLALLLAPVGVFRVLGGISSRAVRIRAKTMAALVTVPYALLWLYIVVALSYLSLPLVLALAAIALTAWFSLTRKTPDKALQPTGCAGG